MNVILCSTNQDHPQGKIRQFFTKNKNYRTFNLSQKVVRDKDDKIILIKLHEKATRRHEYFEELLNSELPKSPVPKQDVYKAEQKLDDISIDKFIKAIIKQPKKMKVSRIR